MKKNFSVIVLSCSLLACTSAKEENTQVSSAENQNFVYEKVDVTNLSEQEQFVYEQLRTFAHGHISKCNVQIIPNKNSPKIEKRNNMYVASYVEFDPGSLSMEIISTPHRKYQYLAKIKYRENLYQCMAETEQSALKGKYNLVSKRFITEVPKYQQGKWKY